VGLLPKLGLVALIALALTVLPGGGAALDVAIALLGIAFLCAIAYLGYRLFRQHRLEIETLDNSSRLVLYGSVAVALLTLTGRDRLFDIGGAGVLAWLALLAPCSYGVFWVWTRYRRLS
jgi:hypothetical protein